MLITHKHSTWWYLLAADSIQLFGSRHTAYMSDNKQEKQFLIHSKS